MSNGSLKLDLQCSQKNPSCFGNFNMHSGNFQRWLLSVCTFVWREHQTCPKNQQPQREPWTHTVFTFLHNRPETLSLFQQLLNSSLVPPKRMSALVSVWWWRTRFNLCLFSSLPPFRLSSLTIYLFVSCRQPAVSLSISHSHSGGLLQTVVGGQRHCGGSVWLKGRPAGSSLYLPTQHVRRLWQILPLKSIIFGGKKG